VISDGDLLELSRSSVDEIRSWLRLNQPASNDDKMYWWENLIARALHVVYTSHSEDNRSKFATLAYSAILEEVDQGMRCPVDGAVRMTDLTAAYLNRGGNETELFDVDSAVARNLDLIEVPVGIAAEQAREWRSLPSDRVFVLRDAKNLVQSCSLIASRIHDPALRSSTV
jgi:hypothetical protein